jgi:hypothetical protein
VAKQLGLLGVETRNGIIISSNVEVRLDGFPRSNQGEPKDPGVAVYWKKEKEQVHKVMATDTYDKVADNLAAIAATLEAMRRIERHGGALILERVFTGFLALPAPNTWRAVMGFDEDDLVSIADVKRTYRSLCKERHPDTGGSEAAMADLNWAMKEAEKEVSC